MEDAVKLRRRALLLLLGATAIASAAESTTEASSPDVPCADTEELCSDSNLGVSSIYIINQNISCCHAGYVMEWRDERCLCRKTQEAETCQSGEDVCASARQVIIEENGNKRCCLGNSTLQSFQMRVKTRQVFTCTCVLESQVDGVRVSSSGFSIFNFQNDGSDHNVTSLVSNMQQTGKALLDRIQAIEKKVEHVFENPFSWF